MLDPDSPSLLEMTRVSRGLTQAALAKKTGLAQGVISKLETGTVPMDEARKATLAEALGVPPTLIDGTTTQVPHVRLFHRKQASLPMKAQNQLQADMILAHVRVEHLLGDVEPHGVPRLPIALDDWFTPADRAREVRALWQVTPGPIPDMVKLMEAHGVPCLFWNVSSARVDAISSWPSDAPPIVLLGSHAPGDRLRFTLAHELGHAVLHDLPSPDGEKEADEFAAEFLMPSSEIRAELENVTFADLVQLKRRWGTSIAALARRARDLGTITESKYRTLNIEMSSAGMRRREPVEIPLESPGLIANSVQDRLESGASLDEIASSALISTSELRRDYLEEKP